MLVYHSAHSVSTSLITSFGPAENSVFVFVCPSSTARFGSVVHLCIIYALWLASQWRGVSWKKVRMRTCLPRWFSHFRQRLLHTYNKKLLSNRSVVLPCMKSSYLGFFFSFFSFPFSMFIFAFQKYFFKKNILCFNLIFQMFLDYFDALILKIIFKT